MRPKSDQGHKCNVALDATFRLKSEEANKIAGELYGNLMKRLAPAVKKEVEKFVTVLCFALIKAKCEAEAAGLWPNGSGTYDNDNEKEKER